MKVKDREVSMDFPGNISEGFSRLVRVIGNIPSNIKNFFDERLAHKADSRMASPAEKPEGRSEIGNDGKVVGDVFGKSDTTNTDKGLVKTFTTAVYKNVMSYKQNKLNEKLSVINKMASALQDDMKKKGDEIKELEADIKNLEMEISTGEKQIEEKFAQQRGLIDSVIVWEGSPVEAEVRGLQNEIEELETKRGPQNDKLAELNINLESQKFAYRAKEDAINIIKNSEAKLNKHRDLEPEVRLDRLNQGTSNTNPKVISQDVDFDEIHDIKRNLRQIEEKEEMAELQEAMEGVDFDALLANLRDEDKKELSVEDQKLQDSIDVLKAKNDILKSEFYKMNEFNDEFYDIGAQIIDNNKEIEKLENAFWDINKKSDNILKPAEDTDIKSLERDVNFDSGFDDKTK